MSWYKRYILSTVPSVVSPDMEDDDNRGFGKIDEWLTAPSPKIIKREPAKTVPVTLTLYRGFDADLAKLKKSGNNYILDPHGISDQGVLWFTCPTFQFDALTVATRGQHLLTYKLNALKHVETIHYEEGPPSEHTPDSFHEKANQLENCRFCRGYELPEGWAFSYKVQKYIICDHPLIVSPAMITEHEREAA